MALAPGTRIGPYEIAAQLGVGGMGEVYRATDTNLKRQVAIKVLPEAVAADAERLARFQREAEVLAALNHPNIAHIHGLEKADGRFALVMELVEGPTLADRIAHGPIPVQEALPIANQIAEALEAAHEQGIIHRDLKPANIKVREDGTVKVLDFGLAKAMDLVGGAASPLNASMSPTITTPAMTQAGMILGTAAYMSPEQARGKPVDKRADVWAFGAVLFEMLTGHAPFPGSDVVEVLGAVVHKEPVWTDLPAETPPAVRTPLQRCLEKDPKRRMRDIGDVRLALTGAFDTPLPATAVAASPSTLTARTRAPWMWVGAALLVGSLATAAAMKFADPRTAPPQPVRRFALTITTSAGPLIAISPDGRVLVYRVREQGVFRLYRRGLDELEATPIPGTDGAGNTPFFSPDGQWLGFRDQSTSMLMRLSLAGGRPVRIGEIAGNYQGASWEADGSIVLGLGSAGLVKVAAGGGVPVTLTKPDDGWLDWYPQTLPGGRAVLFTTSQNGAYAADIMALDLQSGKRQTLLRGGSAGRFLPTGHLIFVRDRALWAVRFNPATLLVSGDPVLVEPGLRVASSGAVQFASADDGTLTYIAGTDAESRTLVWVDRSGREEPLAAPARTYQYPRISPDGERIALDVRDREFDIWIWSVAGQTLTRLTTDPALDEYPVWTPDSQRIAFTSSRAQRTTRNLYIQRADGSGAVERLTTSLRTQISNSVSPDGALIFQESTPTTGIDLMRLALGPPGASPARTGGEGAGAGGAQPLVQTRFPEMNGEVSPDRRWLAYESSDSGRPEIYVKPYPEKNTGRHQVSSVGGHAPLWDRAGRELYFRSMNGAVMHVNVVPGNTWQNSPPEEIVPARYYDISPAGRTFDVAPDGKRFLMIKQPVGEVAVQNIVVVTNWFEELKRLVPAK